MRRICVACFCLVAPISVLAEFERSAQSPVVHRVESLSYSTFNLKDDSTLNGSLKVCGGPCKFLLRYGERAILISKDTGKITAAQFIHRSPDLEEHYRSYHLDDLGVEPFKHSFLQIGDRLFFLPHLLDRRGPIDHGSIKLDYRDSNTRGDPSDRIIPIGGPIGENRIASGCQRYFVHKPSGCFLETDSVRFTWLEFVVESCLASESPIGLHPYFSVIPNDVLRAVGGGMPRPDACKSI